MSLVEEAVAQGARWTKVSEAIGLSLRTLEMWRGSETHDDGRVGPHTRPKNALSAGERKRILEVVDSPEFRNLSPKQVVVRLADGGRYLASESTLYRILRCEGELTHRGRAKPPTSRVLEEHRATGPNQVWSWDITYLVSAVRGRFFYLYMFEDVWSRRIMGWDVHEGESMQWASHLFEQTCLRCGVDPKGLVLHSDNGGPMKGSTMLATLERLGVVASFSRPSVSDDNPYSEALFRTLKYRPEYPWKPFETIEEAQAWVSAFVVWYNTEHRHSAIRFVTPDERHFGRETEILTRRVLLYEQARREHPERWTRQTRNWKPIQEVWLNPRKGRRRQVDPRETSS